MDAHEFLVDLLMLAETPREPTPEEWDAHMEEIARRAEEVD